MDTLLRFQSIRLETIFNLSTPILVTQHMELQRDSMVSNSISIMSLNIQLRERDTISKCTPFTYHMMVINQLRHTMDSWLLLWELSSLLSLINGPEVLKIGRLQSSISSLTLYSGQTAKPNQLSH